MSRTALMRLHSMAWEKPACAAAPARAADRPLPSARGEGTNSGSTNGSPSASHCCRTWSRSSCGFNAALAPALSLPLVRRCGGPCAARGAGAESAACSGGRADAAAAGACVGCGCAAAGGCGSGCGVGMLRGWGGACCCTRGRDEAGRWGRGWAGCGRGGGLAAAGGCGCCREGRSTRGRGEAGCWGWGWACRRGRGCGCGCG